MEVQSFISLKLQTAFPTVWLSFFNKVTFTPHFVQSTFNSQYIKFTENSFLYHFLTWIKAIFYASYHPYCIFRWSTPQTRPWAVWLQHWFFAEPSKLAKNWSWHTKYSSVPQICPPPPPPPPPTHTHTPFAILALVQNAGGLIRGMRQFLSRLRPHFRAWSYCRWGVGAKCGVSPSTRRRDPHDASGR